MMQHNGTVWATGMNKHGQLGDGSSISRSAMVTSASMTTTTTPTPITCPKCGDNTTSGQSSCCFRGGTWFEKCGDFGDPNFNYTWFDGTRACIRPTTATTTTSTPTTTTTTTSTTTVTTISTAK